MKEDSGNRRMGYKPPRQLLGLYDHNAIRLHPYGNCQCDLLHYTSCYFCEEKKGKSVLDSPLLELSLLELPRFDELDLAYNLLDQIVREDNRNQPDESLQGKFQQISHVFSFSLVSLYGMYFLRDISLRSNICDLSQNFPPGIFKVRKIKVHVEKTKTKRRVHMDPPFCSLRILVISGE